MMRPLGVTLIDHMEAVAPNPLQLGTSKQFSVLYYNIIQRERWRERERDRQRDRETDRQTDRQTDRLYLTNF